MIRAAVLVALLVVAGCGGTGSGAEDSPATVAPADAPFYAEVVVRPEGELRESALDALGKILRTDDPSARLHELIRSASESEGEDFDYDRDLGPWLGERIGYWAAPSAEKDNFGAFVVQATDLDAALDSFRASLERGGRTVSERSHGGVEYLVSSEEVAAGVVADFVVFGREAEVRRTIDASEGDSLAEADEYTSAIDRLEEEDRLAHFWADPGPLVEAAGDSMVPLDGLRPVAGSFTADGEELAVEVKTETDDAVAQWLAPGPSPLVQEMPADSWLAGGTADAGAAMRDVLDRAAGSLGGLALRRQLRRDYGLDLDRDVLDWVGHTAFFVRGTTPETLDGGIAIQPTDEDRATAAFGRIVGALQGEIPFRAEPIDIEGADQAFALHDAEVRRPFVLARGSGLVVATLGVPAAEAVLSPDERLGDTQAYAEAEDLATMEPGMMLSMPAVLELVEAAGVARETEFTEIRPYLEAFSVIATGTTADGDELLARLGAGLR